MKILFFWFHFFQFGFISFDFGLSLDLHVACRPKIKDMANLFWPINYLTMVLWHIKIILFVVNTTTSYCWMDLQTIILFVLKLLSSLFWCNIFKIVVKQCDINSLFEHWLLLHSNKTLIMITPSVKSNKQASNWNLFLFCLKCKKKEFKSYETLYKLGKTTKISALVLGANSLYIKGEMFMGS